MRSKSATLLAVFILLFPAALHALPTVSSLYGSWGVTLLIRNHDGTWEAEGGRLVINADGTGTSDTFFNNNGTVGSGLGSAFTYAAAVNGNGTITFTILTPDTETHRIILNDTADMMFMDGTRDLLSQKIGILIRLKDADYNNTDFMGDYNAVAYEYFHGPVITTYRAHAFHFYSDAKHRGGEITKCFCH